MQTSSHTFETKKSQRCNFCYVSIFRLVAAIFAFITVISIILLFKAYIKFVLIWLENQDPIIISATITFLFILVSLPISVGYIVLVIAEGYLFGIVNGLILSIIGANFGLFVAHNILKLMSNQYAIYKYTQNETAQAIMRLISGPLCFKIVFCSRLTPIPFGLQNTIFALSKVNTKIYHLASLLGLLPAQTVGVYAGSTLRSMQDVLENRHIPTTTYVFIALQLLLAIGLIIWFGTKARAELIRALAEADSVV